MDICCTSANVKNAGALRMADIRKFITSGPTRFSTTSIYGKLQQKRKLRCQESVTFLVCTVKRSLQDADVAPWRNLFVSVRKVVGMKAKANNIIDVLRDRQFHFHTDCN